MSKWSEIRNDFYDELEGCICIDAWNTCGDNEGGNIIAKVYKDRVEYIDDSAKKDEHAQESIIEAMEDIKEME